MKWPRMPRLTSLRRRIVVATALLTAVGMSGLMVLVAVVLGHVVSEDIDGVLRDRATSVTSTIEASGDSIRTRETPKSTLDNLVWIYDATGALVEGASTSAALQSDLRELARVSVPTEKEGATWRLRAVPVVLPGESTQAGVVVVGVSLVPYQRTEGRTLALGIGLGILVVVVVSAVAAFAVRRSLGPVAVMAHSASEWSDEDLSRRFNLGAPHDEITQLGEVLDGLLSRVSRTILAEQRLSAELAHELRSPLTVIRAEAELGLLNGPGPESSIRFTRIIDSVDAMTDAITTLMSVARGRMPLTDTVPVDDLLAAVALPGARTEIVVEPAPGVRIAVPQALAVRALAPLVDNAMRFSRTRVTFSARVHNDVVDVLVTDDGPGFGDVPVESLFAPGVHASDSPGAGLGLALARRLARSAGGDVTGEPAARHTTFVLSLPRAGSPPPPS